MNKEKIKKHQEELENEWRYWREFDTREWRDHELIREYLNDAPVRLGEQQLKAGMNNPEMMGSGGKEMKTTHEMLWMDEKNFHNQNNYERMATSSRILKRMEQD